jgi:transposase
MDDAGRSPHNEINHLKALLAQRDQIIATHRQQLIDRDQLLALRDQRIAEFHAALAQRDQVIAEQRSTVASLTQQRDDYQLEKLRLEMRLAKLLKQVYGPRADRLTDPAQLLLDFARQLESLPTPADVAPPEESAQRRPRRRRRLGTRGRRDIGLLDHLPMIEKIYELTGEACRCPTCRLQREKIGEEISYTIEYLPASFLRIKHIQHKYACRACEQEGYHPRIERAEKSGASPIDKGMVGPGLLAYIATSKYADYLPLHRLEEIFARQGFELDRSTMCLWMADVATIVRPVYERMVELVRASHVLATDDTVMPLLQPGRAKRARMWIYRGDEDHPYNVFDFTVSRSRDGPAQFLKGFGGTLLADAYGGYDGIVVNQELSRAGCWAHARRKFVEAAPIAQTLAQAILRLIKSLFDLEDRAVQMTADQRLALRQDEARPMIEALHTLLVEQRLALLPKHPMAQAIGYTLNQWKELTLFLVDGAVPIHNNLAEQQMKRIALLRKNALFVGTERGGHTAAVISSLTSTCQRHGINPQAYLTQVLTNLLDTPGSRIDEWLPNEWKKRNLPPAPPPPAPHPSSESPR